MTLRWEDAPYQTRAGTKDCFVDVEGVGRYFIRRQGSSGRYSCHILRLNNKEIKRFETVKEAKAFVEKTVGKIDDRQETPSR